MSCRVTRQIRVSGRVQGVGYRAALQAQARQARVSGWVRNRADGTVEALLHGPAPAIETLVAWARRGPPGARVAEVQVAEARAPEDADARFELLPTA